VADTSTFLIFFFLKRVKSKIQKEIFKIQKRGQVPKDPKTAYISMVGVQVTESSKKDEKNYKQDLHFYTKNLETKQEKAVEPIRSISTAAP
jgi:hypothetical protein